MTWLVLGGAGQLGQSLRGVLEKNLINHVLTESGGVNICKVTEVERVVELTRPSVIVNCAAWTDVDGAETNEERAFEVNAVGPGLIAGVARQFNVPLLHISTDYVFSGNSTSPYTVKDHTEPLSVYGRTKLEGEKRVREAHPQGAWIVRTAWLYSPYGKNFAKSIVRKALSGEDLSVVADTIGQPTSAIELSSQLVRLVNSRLPAGTYHGTNSGQATWFDFAKSIVATIPGARIHPVSSESFRQIAPRPRYSVLDHSEWSLHGLSPMPHWATSLDQIRDMIVEAVRTETK